MNNSLYVVLIAIIIAALPAGTLAQGAEAAKGHTSVNMSQEQTPAQLARDGMAAYAKGDYVSAAKLLEQAAARGANQNDVLYNAACALALAGDREKAFQFLEKSIQAGYRSTTHLKYDVDFNSLHDDPRWAKIVAACEDAQAKFLKDHNDPANARFITADIARFWAAYDKAMPAAPEDRAAILQREYFDPGTMGLKDFAATGRVSAKALAQRIQSHQAFFKAIRPVTLAVDAQRSATLAAFRKLKELYSDAVFPDVYFVIGQLGSGGTSSSNGLLMGAEIFTKTPGVPAAELSDWQKFAIAPPSDIPALVAHESVHAQQKFASQGGLLCACLVEGGADFVGKLSSGRLIVRMEETHAWANARERELWDEFRKEMDSKDTTHWLYGSSGGNGRPVDLGYWMGFKIAEAYYNNAADKTQALRELLIVPDCKLLLRNSRYADKFAAGSSAPKQ